MTAPSGGFSAPACFAASAVVLGHALQINYGFYDGRALGWLSLALALSVGGLAALRQRLPVPEGRALRFLLAAGAAWQIVSLLNAPPGMYVDPGAKPAVFKGLVIVEGVCAALIAADFRRSRRAAFPALLVAHAVLGTWMLRASPSPHIDVVVVHKEALDALAHGGSPYLITFQNIYGAGTGFYSEAAQVGDRVMFGYPYPPVSLLLAAPGHFLAGDYRYAELAAWIGAAAFVGYVRSSNVAMLAAVLLLTQPRGLFVLEQGWTEPIALAMLAATVFAMARNPSLAPWAGGLLIVTKQYLALAAPLFARFALAKRGAPALLARAVLIGAVVTLPFFLWQPKAFLESVVLLQTREPFRIDSLSYLSWAARHGWGAGSFLWAVGAAVAAMLAGMALTPNSPGGFAAALAFSAFASFAFGSKAFCNYYFFVAGALCCAVAALDPVADDLGDRPLRTG
jgi:hypothetical protein